MEKEIAHFEVRGRKVRELRGGDGAPLLYLHGAGAENEFWLPFADALAERYAFHAPSHPGFLDSDGLDEMRLVADIAAHYADYIDAKGWDRVAVAGLSFGGWIAAELAARYPEKVAKLVLVDAVGIWIHDDPIVDLFAIDVARFPERMRRLLFADPKGALPMMAFPDAAEGGDLPDLPDEEILKQMNHMAAVAKFSWNPLLHNPRLPGLLHRISAETLIIWGKHDGLVSTAYAKAYGKLIPNSRVEIIDSAGHLPPLETPDLFIEKVAKFVG